MPDEIIVTKLSDHELDDLRDKKLVESQAWEKTVATLEDEAHGVEVEIAGEEKKKIDIDNEILNLQNKLKGISLNLKELRLKKNNYEHEITKGRSCRRIVDKDYARLTNEMFRRQKGH
jgi:Ribonuclease G/E